MSTGAPRSTILVGWIRRLRRRCRWAAREAAMRMLPIKLIHAVAPTLVSSMMGPHR